MARGRSYERAPLVEGEKGRRNGWFFGPGRRRPSRVPLACRLVAIAREDGPRAALWTAYRTGHDDVADADDDDDLDTDDDTDTDTDGEDVAVSDEEDGDVTTDGSVTVEDDADGEIDETG